MSKSIALSGSCAKGMGEGQEYVVGSCSSWFPRHVGLVKYIGSMAIFDWPEDGLHNYWAAMFVRQSKRTEITLRKATLSGEVDAEPVFLLLRYVFYKSRLRHRRSIPSQHKIDFQICSRSWS